MQLCLDSLVGDMAPFGVPTMWCVDVEDGRVCCFFLFSLFLFWDDN